MKSWILGFCLGCLFSCYSSAYSLLPGCNWIPIVVCFSSALSKKYAGLVFNVWIATLGFIYAASNNAPLYQGPINPATLASSGYFAPYSSTSLIWVKGHVYLAMGTGSPSNKGYVSHSEGSIWEGRWPCFETQEQKGSIRHLLLAKNWFDRQTKPLPPLQRKWYQSIFLGETQGLPLNIKQGFSSLGIFHLLVISGMHISLFAFFLTLFGKIFLRGAYIFRLISPRSLLILESIWKWSVWSVLFNYILIIQAKPAAQRALLCHIIQTNEWTKKQSTWNKLITAAVVQSILFPIGFFSKSLFISWATYILVINALPRVPTFKDIWILQWKLTVLSSATIKTLPLLGVLANILLLPIYPIIYGTAFFSFFSQLLPGLVVNFLVELQASFLMLITWTHKWVERVPELLIFIPDFPVLWSIVQLLAGAILIQGVISIKRHQHERQTYD